MNPKPATVFSATGARPRRAAGHDVGQAPRNLRHVTVQALILGGLLLAGCSNTALSTHIGITPNGLRVTPVLSTRVGGAQVSVSP